MSDDLHGKTAEGRQMVSGAFKKCGHPTLDPDGRKRVQVSATVPAKIGEQVSAWRKQRHEVKPIARPGDIVAALVRFGQRHGFNPVE